MSTKKSTSRYSQTKARDEQNAYVLLVDELFVSRMETQSGSTGAGGYPTRVLGNAPFPGMLSRRGELRDGDERGGDEVVVGGSRLVEGKNYAFGSDFYDSSLRERADGTRVFDLDESGIGLDLIPPSRETREECGRGSGRNLKTIRSVASQHSWFGGPRTKNFLSASRLVAGRNCGRDTRSTALGRSQHHREGEQAGQNPKDEAGIQALPPGDEASQEGRLLLVSVRSASVAQWQLFALGLVGQDPTGVGVVANRGEGSIEGVCEGDEMSAIVSDILSCQLVLARPDCVLLFVGEVRRELTGEQDPDKADNDDRRDPMPEVEHLAERSRAKSQRQERRNKANRVHGAGIGEKQPTRQRQTIRLDRQQHE